MSVSYTMFEEAMEELTRMRERIEQLEDLCRAMYGRIKVYNDVNDRLRFDMEMDELGLLEGEEDG